MVDLICMKAEDEGGTKLFASAEDRLDLMGEETSVISDIANQMFAEIESAEVARKKLRSDHSRMNLLSLADRLHMSIAEAEQTPVSHLNEWVAYHKIVGEKND